MSNSGNATLNIASIAITGSNRSDFSQTNTCGQTLAPSVSCSISVIFKPTASGQRTAGVAITSDARGSAPVVTLSGTGLAVGLDLSTSLLIFDNQTVGTTSGPQTITLSNSGATAAAITSITANGDYAQTNNCGSSLAASSNCAIRVTFTPTATGTRTGSISIVGGDSSTPLVVNLTGTGVVVTLSLSPASLTFNDQKVGTSSQAQSIALTDTGGASLTINSIVPSGDFLETDNCGNGLAAGTGCSINVTFLPTATGARTGSITITSNAQGSPHTVKLMGNGISRGPAVSLTCASGGAAAASTCTIVTFPAQPVTTTSGGQVVTLTNAGNDTLNISGVMATSDFTASTCPATLAPSASCSINVTFTPTATGNRVGSLLVMDNAGDSPQSVSLMGTGTPFGPAISLSATALPFGNQFVGATSGKQSVTVTNVGSATLTFMSIKASGDFAETDDCGTSVAKNATCTISVTFTPTATGPRAGAITISDNAPASPQAVTLSGNGTDIVISAPPGGSTSASVSAGQSATFPLTLSPAGGFSGPVTVSCSGTIPAGTCSASPGTLTLNAPVMVTMTVTTTAPSHSTNLPVPGLSPRNLTPLRSIMQLLLLLVTFLLFSIAALRRRRSWIVVTAGLFIFAFISGCAGGSTNPGVVGPTVGTPANTYTLTVVITTASGATRTMPLTVVVH
jgi:Abnormal spindle-like microcephaly-assoc'd, ASPM-SPD-2-Hydin